MSRVFILGAGCSRNYDESNHGISGLKSPLNSDFFKMAKKVIENSAMKHDRLFMNDIESLLKKLSPLYGDNDSSLDLFENDNLNLEEAMTILDTEYKLFRKEHPNLAFGESVYLRTLKDLIARTLDYSLRGTQCSKHRKLARKMRKDDIVLSFNYDILMDNALYNTRKFTDSGYKVIFHKVNDDDDWVNPNETNSEVTLLKLHGSLNWIKCGGCGQSYLFRYRKQTLLGSISFTCPHCSSTEQNAKRLVIPPVLAKEYLDKEFQYLWSYADNEIFDITHIVSIGYSFSLSDYDMIYLMRRLRSRIIDSNNLNHTKFTAEFVSPDIEAFKRFKNLLGLKDVRLYDNLEKYLETSEYL